MSQPENKPKIIFFGSGPLADATKAVLEPHFDLIFHAKTREDLETVKQLKLENPSAHAILASYGVLIKPDILDLFEPEGILNIHPSLLPQYRGPSPIETAILNGDTTFGVSVMKLVKAMDAGPIYYQTSIPVAPVSSLSDTNVPTSDSSVSTSNSSPLTSGSSTPTSATSNTTTPVLPLNKAEIYRILAETGANWLVKNLTHLPAPTPQNNQNATFTQKITKDMAIINPKTETAEQILRKIIAFQGFPKIHFPFYGHNCLILAAHLSDSTPSPASSQTRLKTPPSASKPKLPLSLTCADGQTLIIDRLQPEGKRPMDPQSFLNGYAK